MTARQIFTLILLCAGLLCRVWAQPGDGPRISDVSHYRSYDGLASERVYSIQQTSDGAVWFGTRVGVDRFNGRTFTHYAITDHQSRQDYAGRVIRLFHRRGQLLCAYDNKGRIFAYDSRRDAFGLDIRLGDHLQGDIVLNAVSAADDGSLLIGLVRGLYRYSNGKVSQLNGHISVNDIDTDGSTVYAAATDGLYTVSGRHTVRQLPGIDILTVHCDGPGGVVYLGTVDRGLWQYDSRTRHTRRVAESTRELERPIRAIERLDAHHIAVGIDGGGVYLYDQRDGSARLLIDTDDSNAYCLNGNGVYTLLRDSYGTLWAGSYTGGATAMQFHRGAVTTLLHRQGNPNTLCNNNINGIAQSAGGDIWFATDRGMSILSARSGTWHHPEPKNVIICLEPTADGGMLAGTYGAGIYRLNAQGAVVGTLTKQNGQLTSNSIFSILRSSAGEYWAASLDGGVMRLDANLRPVTTYAVSVAFSLTETPDHRIAVGTANGYYVIDPATGRKTQYAGADEFAGHGSSYIISMLYDSPGRVWLGTEGGGIYLYDQARRKVLRNYTTADGLPANNVYSIQRDRRGLVVVSTGNGLAMMQQGRFKSLNYYRGLGKEYNKSAGTLLSNGDMVFGSVYGAEMVVPSQLAEADFEARVRITGITGMRQVADSAAAADNSVADVIAQGERLPIDGNRARLDYANNSFTVHFEAINLPFQDDIAYQYLLQGYEDTWSPVSAYNQAEYKNVSSGDYTFRVRSVRRSDGMVLDEVAMPLTVGTPWWLSWWAWTLYVLIGVGVVVFIYRYNWFKLRELHDRDKIRFFINTAHDIRTPVSLVMAPVNDLKADTTLSPQARKLVETAASNIAKLYSVTTQLLEFERFDTGGERLDLKPVDLNGLLTLEAECFRDACRRKRISLLTQLPGEKVAMTGDHYLLEMLMDNLLSNACKYTNEGGQITLALTADRRRVQLTVSDNGIGIPTRERRKVLREVYRAGNARQTNATGTGFGLLQARRITELLGGKIKLQSTEGVGTTVTISFARLNAQAETVGSKQTHTFVDSGVQLSPVAVATANLEPLNDQTRTQHHSLLIVEDNDELRGYLHDMFAPIYNVHAAADAEQALEHLQRHYPDLILSDVMMPGMQGDELCRRLKSDPATAGIPVVLLTAKADHDSVVGGLQCGADDYLPKPFNSDILRLKVQGIIANRDRLRHQLLNTAISRAVDATVSGDCSSQPVRGAGPASDANLLLTDYPNDSYSDRSAHHGETPWPPEADAAGGVSAADRAFVSKATDLVLANLADPEFGIEQLCRQMAMSRTLFYSRLKALTGQAPQDFIRMLRLERAAKLLGQQVPVAEAAESCGFANVKYFSTVFKKHFGLQPSRYAAQHQQ